MIFLVKRVYVEYLPLGVGTHKGTNEITLHYYILCFFAKGQTKNLNVLRKKKKT
jgi:hypothetical protein